MADTKDETKSDATDAVSGDTVVAVGPKGGAPDVVTTATAPKTTKEAKKTESRARVRWIVEHSMLGTQNPETTHNYVRGEVVTEEDLGEAFDRYRQLGAIKPYVKVDDTLAEVEAPTEEG